MAKDKQVSDVVQCLQRGKGDPETDDWGGAVFLIGAGCSKSAGVPLGREIAATCMVDLAKMYSNGEFETTDAMEAKQWLENNGDLEKGLTDKNLYGHIFSRHFHDAAAQREVIQAALKASNGKINWAHLCLGQLVSARYAHTVLTTNFEQLVLEGIIRTGLIPVVADGVESLSRISGKPQHPQVVHLHGSLHTYNLRNTIEDMERTGDHLGTTTALCSLFRDSQALIVVGYDGSEPGIMDLLVRAAEYLGSNKSVYWVLHSANPEDLSSMAEKLLEVTQVGGVVLDQDADDFFRELMRGVGLGVPQWMKNPIGFLEKRADSIQTDGQSRDIKAEVGSYRKQLSALKDCLEEGTAPPGAEADAKRDEARSLRLSGRLEAALEALKFVPAEERTPEDLLEIGNTSLELGEREEGTARLEEAVAAFRAVLEVYTRADFPDEWAMTQNNLGNALSTLGEREEGTARLEEAVAAYRGALEVRTRADFPPDWAMTQNNLGNALVSLGEREEGTARLEEAVGAFEAVLEVHTRADFPVQWAATQNNLAIALRILGEREEGTARLEEAVTAYRQALEVRTRADFPVQWARTQNNLGNVLFALGGREEGTARLEEAVGVFEAALEVLRPAGATYFVTVAERNLAKAQAMITERREAGGKTPDS